MTQKRPAQVNNRRQAARIRRKRKKKIQRIAILAAAVVIIAAVIIIIAASAGNSQKNIETEKENPAADTVGIAGAQNDAEENLLPEAEQGAEENVQVETEPEEPYVVGTATIGASGDILTHNYVLNSAYDWNGNYDFTNNFAAIAPYWSDLDYMIVNLEVPCSGSEGEKGNQYPTFDAPDSIVTALKDAGVDMFLTASNHTNDCGGSGIIHTQELINSLGLDHVGTRLSSSDDFYLIKDINGIKFGMACYTYDTREELGDTLSLNGIPVGDDYADLVNSFCYSDPGLDLLYSQVESDMKAMEAKGCDVKVIFMHWGTEYMDEPSAFIQGFAQKLSDLGADLIIGGHPHVIQPFDILEGAGGNSTYCIYSTGNCISSQRKEVMNEDDYRGYTEDGLTISFTYEKLSDGSTSLKDIFVLPTWVDGDYFSVVPLDASVSTEQWATYYTYAAMESYNRTEGRIGEKYNELRERLGLDAVPTEIY